jgi:energy-converting hydrogenase Eha subunit F
MKTMKRLLSMLLVTVMVLGLAVPALADSDPVTSTVTETGGASKNGSVQEPIESITVSKTVTAQRGVTLPTETFYLEMVPATADELKAAAEAEKTEGNAPKVGNVTIQPGIDLADPVLDFTFDGTDSMASGSVTKSKDFALDFTSDYTAQGIYRYYIREVVQTSAATEDAAATYDKATNPDTKDGKMNYIQYDTNEYIVDLYLNWKDENTLVVTNTVVQLVGSTSKPGKIEFTNEINTTTVMIKKLVDGVPAHLDEKFDFYILIPVGGDTITLTADQKIQCQIYDKNDKPVDGGVTELTVKGANIDVDAAVDGTKFQLRDGDYMIIYAPLSMIFKVQEADYSKDSYVTTAAYTESGAFTDSKTVKFTGTTYDDTNDYDNDATDGIVTVKGTSNTDTDVVFTNTRKIDVKTGINLDILPYVLVLVGALAIGGVWFFFRKRRTVR